MGKRLRRALAWLKSGERWCTNCTCFWFPIPADGSVTLAPTKVPFRISGGQSARRYIFSEGWRTGIVQILTVIGWHQAPGMGHAAGRSSVLPLSTETHSRVLLTPSAAGLSFFGPWPGWAHFLMCCAFGAHLWCAEMKLCFLFVGGHVTRHVGSLFPD